MPGLLGKQQTITMTDNSLHIPVALANRIFQRANQAATPGELLGMLIIEDNTLRFESQANADRSGDNRLPVYLHNAAGNSADSYLLVETGTKGVMQLRACRREHGKIISLPIVT